MTEHTFRKAANRALALVLGAGIVAWAFFMLATLSDIIIEAGHTWEELTGPDAVVSVRPSIYLFFAAVAVFTIGGLLGRRKTAQLQAAGSPAPLARAVSRLATTVMIIGMALAAFGAFIVFMSNFSNSVDNDGVFERVLNSYLPIVLYTALVIAVILTGFVFAPLHATSARQAEVTDDAPISAVARSVAPDPGLDPGEPHTIVTTPAPVAALGQRATALAYTLPITAAAVALVFGLIVYDVTQTSLDAWIWVIVMTIIAVGIVAGTIYAARALRAQVHPGAKPAGASIGAKNLNFILSIIFVTAVTSMSLGYGASAMGQLRVQSSLSISVYSDKDISTAADSGVDPTSVTLSTNGYDLARGSDAVVSLEPGGEVLSTVPVDRGGSFWNESALPSDLKAGDYDITATVSTADGRDISTSLPMTVLDDGAVRLTAEPYASVDDEASRFAAPTVGWFAGDLAPAAIMLLLAVATLRLTLNTRNRKE